MKKNNKQPVYKKGFRMSLYIRNDVSDELISWLNRQAYAGPSILHILDKYVNGELVSVDVLKDIGNKDGYNTNICYSNKTKMIDNASIDKYDFNENTEEKEKIEGKTKAKEDVREEIKENILIGNEIVEEINDAKNEQLEPTNIKDSKRPPLSREFSFAKKNNVKSRFGDNN